MNEPLEEVYFRWLYAKVASVDIPTPSRTHWQLLRVLHTTEFVWLISGDDNRAEGGVGLRQEFAHAMNIVVDPMWHHVPCSVLEMLIAFSRIAEFETDIHARDWFWIMLTNLGLSRFSDNEDDPTFAARPILDRFIWRTYRRNGKGGLFPLENPQHDQKKTEIWYQFCEYLTDQQLI